MSSGTIGIAEATQASNTFKAGPSSGPAAAPTYRLITSPDLPPLNVNAQTANYTLTIGDAGGVVNVTGTSTVTIPANINVAFPIGTQMLVAGSNATIAPASGVTVNTVVGQTLVQTALNTWTLCNASGGSGTVTSVAMIAPSWLTVTGSPVTGAGTLALAANTGLAANLFLATPDGATGALSPRALVSSDLPAGTKQIIASGTATLGTAAIASGSAASAVTVPAPGVLTSDVINWGFNSNPLSTVGYEPSASGTLQIVPYPTSDNVNFAVVNNTPASITPGAVTINWSVSRSFETFRLTGTLPNATAGTAWTGTLNLVGGYISPVTISAASGTIPAWMGTPTLNYTANTVTWSATPTTGNEGTYSFTPQATDSSAVPLVAVGAPESVIVNASGTITPSLVQGQMANSNVNVTSITVTLGVAPTSGNLLVAQFIAGGTGTQSAPAGWTLKGSNTGNARSLIYTKTSNGTETSSTFSVTGSGVSMGAVVVETTNGIAGTMASSSTSQAATPVNFGPTGNPVSSNAIPLVFVTGNIPIGKTYTWSSGWTGSNGSTTTSTYNTFFGYESAPPGTTTSGTLSTGTAGSGITWNTLWIEPA